MVVGQGSIALYPKLKGAKYGPYKEAWHLLREGLPARAGHVDRIEACAEDAAQGWVGMGVVLGKVSGRICRSVRDDVQRVKPEAAGELFSSAAAFPDRRTSPIEPGLQRGRACKITITVLCVRCQH